MNDNNSTIAGSPTTINVADGADGNDNHQANMANEATQESVNPCAMICNMMSSASACSARYLSRQDHSERNDMSFLEHCRALPHQLILE